MGYASELEGDPPGRDGAVRARSRSAKRACASFALLGTTTTFQRAPSAWNSSLSNFAPCGNVVIAVLPTAQSSGNDTTHVTSTGLFEVVTTVRVGAGADGGAGSAAGAGAAGAGAAMSMSAWTGL